MKKSGGAREGSPYKQYSSLFVARTHNVIAPSPALTSLKLALGTMGRSDFITARPDYFGDLLWPTQKVTVLVEDCLVFGCPYHSVPPDTIERPYELIAPREKRERVVKKTRAQGWMVMRFWACATASDPKWAAQEISKVLSQIEANMDGVTDSVSVLARIATLDMSSRLGRDGWKEFLEIIDDIGMDVQRLPIRDVMIRRGWSKEATDVAWVGARWHGLFRRTGTRWIRKTKMWRAARYDVGLVRGKKTQWKARTTVKDSPDSQNTPPGDDWKSETESRPRTPASTPPASSQPSGIVDGDIGWST